MDLFIFVMEEQPYKFAVINFLITFDCFEKLNEDTYYNPVMEDMVLSDK
jgi:hypothetical protein